MGVLVRRPVRVKVVVTDAFKASRADEIRKALGKLDDVGKRIGFELAAAARMPEKEADRLGERLRAGQRNNDRARAALAAELEKVNGLVPGDEYDRGILDGMAEVEVGDDYSKLGACEIVVKDGKIVEVREQAWPEPSETSS